MSEIYYKPDNFILEELVPSYLFEKWKDIQHKVWQNADYRMLYTLQRLRNRYGRMRMNNWHRGGPNQHKCLRPLDYKGYEYLSAHKFFMAGDPTPLEHNPDIIRADILNDPFHEDFKHITCLEFRISWVHFDVRNYDKGKYGILKVDKDGRVITDFKPEIYLEG